MSLIKRDLSQCVYLFGERPWRGPSCKKYLVYNCGNCHEFIDKREGVIPEEFDKYLIQDNVFERSENESN